MPSKLPSKVVRLGDVAEVRKGMSFTGKSLVPGNIPVIAGGKEPAYYHNIPNRHGRTITVSASGAHAGFVAYHSDPIFATDCTTIQSSSDHSDTQYLYYYLKHRQEDIYRRKNGSAQPHVYPRDLANLKIVLPTIDEQLRIVNILDSVDKAYRTTEELQSKTEQLRDATLHKLLTRGLPGHHTEWKKVSGLGTVPATWRVAQLGDIVDIIGGSTPSRKVEEYWGPDIPWVVPSELTKLSGRYLTSTKEAITMAGLQSSSLRIIPPQSILLTTRATIGVVAINLIPITTNQGFQNLVPKNKNYTLWLYYHLLFSKPNLIRRASGSTFLELSRNSVRSITIALPTKQERTTITDILDSIDSVIEQYRNNRDIFLTISRSISSLLLTGRQKIK